MSSSLLKNATVLIHDANDHLTPHPNTSILITDDTITSIGTDLTAPRDSKVLDCTGKIITPGLIDTHHHLWQTQLKGRHADEQLLEYMGSGNMQSYNYRPDDSFWGQLSGCMEAIDAGTTTVLDHSHGSYTQEHAEKILDATVASGLRCILAYAPIMRLTNWDREECVPSQDLTLPWVLDYIEALLQKGQPINGTVYTGLGFDLFFLPKEFVLSIYERMRKAGVKLITTHVVRNLVFGMASTTKLLEEYGLLGKDILLSHATGIDEADKKILWDKGVYVSSTPETECQMAMGWPIALHKDVHGSLGVDCHTNNSSSIVTQARMALQMARQETAIELGGEGRYPRTVRGDTEKMFNLATIEGARALGMEEEIGSIKEGKKADLVVWEWRDSVGMLGCEDPVVAVMRHSDLRDVDAVVVDGKVRKAGGRLCAVEVGGGKMEWKEVAEKVRGSREEMYKRMERCSLEKMRELLVGMFGIDDGKLVGVD
jgi:cytosine/adenosine deaminase-related metal-dependent hydrolase